MNFKTLNDQLKRNKIGSYVPVYDQLEGTNYFLINGNSLGFMFICDPSPGVYDHQKDLLSELFKLDYPIDTVCQITLSALPDLHLPLSQWATTRGGRMSGPDKEKADLLNAYMLDYFIRSQHQPLKPDYDLLTLRDFQVWFSYSIPLAGALPTDAELRKIDALYTEVQSKLRTIGMRPFAASGENWLYCMDKILNPGAKTRWSEGNVEINTMKHLNDQLNIPGRKFKIDADYFATNTANSDKSEKRYFKQLSVRKFPEYIGFGAIYELVVNWLSGNKTVFSPFMATLTVQFPNQSKQTKENLRYKAVTNKQASIPIVVTFCPRLKDMDNDYMAITKELEDGAKLLLGYLTFTVMGDSYEGVRDAAEQMKSFYSESKVNLTDDSYIVFPSLLSTLPMCNDAKTIRDLDRAEVMTNTGAAHLAPIFGPWKGNTDNPVLNLVSREGQLVGIDIFKTSASYNVVVGATSGAGKSFFASYLVNNYLGAGPRTNPLIHYNDAATALKENLYYEDDPDGAQVFVVDVGRSYQGLASQYVNSQFIDFGKSPTFTLNPFAFLTDVANEEEYTAAVSEVELESTDTDELEQVDPESKEEKQKDRVAQTIMVLNQLKMMASESGQISDFQQAVMLNYVTEEYKAAKAEGRAGSVTSFANRCMEHEDKRIKDIGIQLQSWCEGGIYGSRFTDKLPPINFDSRFIVLELEELKGTPHLQTVVLMSIIQAAQHAMFIKRDGRRRLFLLDEAWEYIRPDDSANSGKHANNNFFSSFLEAAWRRFRKTNCAGVCITQSFEDYFTSSVGRALANNSPWKFILKQEKEAIEAMKNKQYLSSSASDYERMKYIRTQKGVFSELMIRFENIQSIVRLYVDRKMDLCYTTDSADRNKIWDLQDQGYSYSQAIDAIYEEELKTKKKDGISRAA
ncbi:TraC family protein (plasmid) [Rahnella aceris]